MVVHDPKTILCFGDSNTWGYDPATGERFGFDERWPGVLRRELGDGFHIIEEGQSGRTTVWDDPIEGDRNGRDYLPACLYSHRPLDLIVLMLGTNDLKSRFSVSAFDIAQAVGVLVDIVQRSGAGRSTAPPRLLLLAPPPLAKLRDFAEMFEGGAEKSKQLATHYRRLAAERGCAFLDAGEVAVTSDIDGVHLEAAHHRTLGMAVAERVRELLAVEGLAD